MMYFPYPVKHIRLLACNDLNAFSMDASKDVVLDNTEI